jgi:YidC/Oxa1 family membrane protein insertase
MSNIGDPAISVLTQLLGWLHDIVEPATGIHAWGWAIVMLTLIVRIALLPLAIKQTRSMRAMQKLQPQMKELQKKYKVDRTLLKKDPEQYKAKKQKLNEEMMALYQREGANPAASCLPLLAQAPIFIALFWTLVRSEELRGQPFYFVTRYVPEEGLTGPVSGAGWPGWLLIALMAGTMFLAQKQMMARNPMQAEGPMAQQQKIMLYAMPALLAVISFQFPLGVLLYWVTTNFWQVAQQSIILREVKHELEEERRGDQPLSKSATTGGDGAPSKGQGSKKDKPSQPGKGGTDQSPKSGKGQSGKGKDQAGKDQAGKGKGKDQAGKGKGAKHSSDEGAGPAANGKKKQADGASGAGGSKQRRRDHIPRRHGGQQG